MQNYKVVYSGTLKPGTDPEQFVQGFIQTFKVPEVHARKLVSPGRAVTLKEKLDQAQAERYRQVLEKLGMQVQVEAMGEEGFSLSLESESAPVAAPPEATPQKVEATVSTAPRCPKCGSNRVEGDNCLACGVIISRYNERQARIAAEAAAQQNPYAAPRSDVTPVQPVDGSAMTGPHSMPTGNGWQWIADAWGYFRASPGVWIGAVIVWLILMVVLSLIPFLGSIATALLGPVFTAGFMIGADKQRQGGSFDIGDLFAGFSRNAGSLMLVGLFYMLGFILIIAVVAGGFGGAVFALGEGGGGDLGMTLVLAVLVMLALMLPLVMAYWFAPVLVALEGIAPFAAMKLSFSACMKNMLPFLLYGLVLLVLFIVALIPLGLGLLVMAPVGVATMYTAYRDIFYQPASE